MLKRGVAVPCSQFRFQRGYLPLHPLLHQSFPFCCPSVSNHKRFSYHSSSQPHSNNQRTPSSDHSTNSTIDHRHPNHLERHHIQLEQTRNTQSIHVVEGMDLSSLQNTLPKGSKASPSSLPPPALTADFKAAALAVTKLYQNSTRQIDHARQEGYLSAVQEVAALLSSGELAGDRLREWCAVGLSRITAQQDEENRTRPTRTHDETTPDDDRGREEHTELTPPASSPVLSNRMELPTQPLFGETEFTFSSPVPGVEFSRYPSPFTRGLVEPEVTYEVIQDQRENGGGRKRGVNQQLGSIWDVTGAGNKRSRYN